MKKTLSIILTLVLTVSMLSVFQASALNPLIVTADDLLAIAKNPSASYRLGADIDMSKVTLTKPIAESFSGTLDGNGYSIKNLTIKGENAALFGTVTGTVSNIYIKGNITASGTDQVFAAALAKTVNGGRVERVYTDVVIKADSKNITVGGIASMTNGSALIENCKTNGSITLSSPKASAWINAGGVIGYINDKGTKIINCTNAMAINADNKNIVRINAGGILGYANNQFEINSCSSLGKITLNAPASIMAGGITSVVANLTFINRSENRGNISAVTTSNDQTAYAGGIVAEAAGGKDGGGSVANCANYANVKATDIAGGIVGHVNGKAFVYNFVSAKVSVSGKKSGDFCGLIDIYNRWENNHFGKKDSYTGLDFTNIWKMADGEPALRTAGVQDAPKTVKPVAVTPKFRDVKKTDWFYDKIEYALTYKIFAGKSAELFGPKDNMTRAEFVQVLANLEKVDTSNKKVKTSFSDVKSGDWFAPAVKWASDNKIVGGMGNGTFAPNKPISRQEMCVMLINYIDFKDFDVRKLEAKESFKDDKVIDDWAKTKVYACQMADIVNGKGGGIFDPKATALRSEVASLFKNFHQSYIG